MTDNLRVVTLKIPPHQIKSSLSSAWLNKFQSAPKKESILCLMAQSAIKTDRWKSVNCYNIELSKFKENTDYMFISCNELLPYEQAKLESEKDPKTTKITAIKGDKAWIWFYRETAENPRL